MNYSTERSGACIRQLRIQSGYTQEKLAGMLSVDRSFLSRIESGKKGCSIDLLVQLSDLFGVSLDYIVMGKEHDDLAKHRNSKLLETDINDLIDHLEQFKAGL